MNRFENLILLYGYFRFMFINIHTHHVPAGPNAVLNVLKDFDVIPGEGIYSAGLHPWYLEKDNEAFHLSQLKSALQKRNVIAVGECGMDKVCNTDYQLQEYYFSRQIELANESGKPLIIHCVRAFDEILHLLKQEKISVPVIFHGYHKSYELAERIVRQGYFLSFGKQLEEATTAKVFASIPLNHLFLETDAADIAIEELYLVASSLKGIPLATLEEKMATNAATVFGNVFC